MDEKSFTPIETGDGSSTFYSNTFGEWFHSRAGAYCEAQNTYVKTTQLAKRSLQQNLKILDICYGLGYNTAAALETIWATNPNCQIDMRALELNIEVPKSAIAHNLICAYPIAVQQALKDIATNAQATGASFAIQLLIGDARQTISSLINNWQADVIFLDPFSPPHCPQLWTVEFLTLVAQCLNPKGGVLVTYSCAAAVRTALQLAGLKIGSIPAVGKAWPGTIATRSDRPLPPLSQQEKEHLQTRAAIPYRDPTLAATAKQILAQRTQAQQGSNLRPTSQWRKYWKTAKTNSPT